jgi:ATP phosphoribosyltransferase regulatory subunit
MAKAFADYGYSPVEPPILEAASLFLDRSGEEIRRRMYVFHDLGGREICLRPELTIPTCRLFLRELGPPARETRLSYIGPVFRYESPSEGRYRQFHQAGVECIGATQTEAADAEALALAVDAVSRAGIEESVIEIGDLDLLRSFIDGLPIGERQRARLQRYLWRLPALRRIMREAASHEANLGDRSGSASDPPAFLEILSSLGVERSRLVVEEILSLTDIRHVGDRSADEIAFRLLARAEETKSGPLSDELVDIIERLLAINGTPEDCFTAVEEQARAAGVTTMGPVLERGARRLRLFAAFDQQPHSLKVDLSLRRGIEYYTSFIFEIHVPGLRESSQVCGGGRYDRLLHLLGAPREIPAVGFAIGLDRLQLALEKQGASKHVKVQRPDALVVAAGSVEVEACIRVAAELRRAGWSVQVDLSARRPRSILDYALKQEIRRVVFVGEEEARRGEVRIKDLLSRQEEVVALDHLRDFVTGKTISEEHL